ncbi:secreted RxLR effector protein 161-like [Lotus japonicus]|uniref:secreted RxLR effector protein 161-like n=1 Tax=Lotus japonicus TaxID=34305 RepID=UPI002582C70C|nr:secreted RxLR effector protein 161-like [Lotus japonicus]
MYPNTVLEKNDEGSPVDQTSYRGMIGSLLYLMSNRPDIMYSDCLCARFKVNPQQSHLSAVKQIFRYLIVAANLGLLYEKGSDFRLKGFCDANYVGDRVERKSTSGGCHFLGNCLVSWTSKRQSTISISTAEPKYVVASTCSTQLLWIKHQLEDYNIHEINIPLLCDNTSAINIAKNLVQHSRTKHIEIKHHFIRYLMYTLKINLLIFSLSHY